MTDPVTLSAHDARIELDGSVACERVSCDASGSRIVLAAGASPALAAALAGRATVTAGALTLDGLDVAASSHFGHVGIAPLDPPVPRTQHVVRWVALSFLIAGYTQREAERSARRVLEELGLQCLASRRMDALALAERRAVAIAQAMIPGARALFAEAPLSSLEPAAASYVLRVLAAACASRAVVTTASRTDPLAPERDLLLGADHLVLFSGEAAAWQGDPAELLRSDLPLLLLQVQGDTHSFLAAARQASFEIQGDPPRILVRLPEGVPRSRLLEIAASCDAVILELIPVWP